MADNSIGGYDDDEGDFQPDSSGVEKLAEALKVNKTLTSVKYAAMLFVITVKTPDIARLLCVCAPLLQLGEQCALRDQFYGRRHLRN